MFGGNLTLLRAQPHLLVSYTKYDMYCHLLFNLHSAMSIFIIDVIFYQVKMLMLYSVYILYFKFNMCW